MPLSVAAAVLLQCMLAGCAEGGKLGAISSSKSGNG
jgi:outer membrane murein-binding lipoprotein Lpp